MSRAGVSLRLRRRQQIYRMLSGITVGSLLAGLAHPFVLDILTHSGEIDGAGAWERRNDVEVMEVRLMPVGTAA